jgi:hypothetical protein
MDAAANLAGLAAAVPKQLLKDIENKTENTPP